MTRYYASNNWETTINDSGGIDDSVTSVVVTDSTGHPTVPFKITIDDEIMNVTNVTSNTLTIVRGQESTSAAAHTDGTAVEHRPTAEVWNDLWDRVDVLRADVSTPLGREVVSSFPTVGNFDGRTILLSVIDAGRNPGPYTYFDGEWL